jgi:hypothetical protein
MQGKARRLIKGKWRLVKHMDYHERLIEIYQRGEEMADSAQVQVFIDARFKQCVSALQQIALLGDTMSEEHHRRFNTGPGQPIANGWRVAEAMREIANDAVGALEIGEDLTIYKRAMESMAAQFVHPKMTALELAKSQLGAV